MAQDEFNLMRVPRYKLRMMEVELSKLRRELQEKDIIMEKLFSTYVSTSDSSSQTSSFTTSSYTQTPSISSSSSPSQTNTISSSCQTSSFPTLTSMSTSTSPMSTSPQTKASTAKAKPMPVWRVWCPSGPNCIKWSQGCCKYYHNIAPHSPSHSHSHPHSHSHTPSQFCGKISQGETARSLSRGGGNVFTPELCSLNIQSSPYPPYPNTQTNTFHTRKHSHPHIKTHTQSPPLPPPPSSLCPDTSQRISEVVNQQKAESNISPMLLLGQTSRLEKLVQTGLDQIGQTYQSVCC